MPEFNIGPKCHFLDSKGQGCSRPAAIGTKRCIFHSGELAEGTEVLRLLKNEDGDWRGFKLPGGLRITEEDTKELGKINFPINLEGAEIASLTIENIDFIELLNLSEARFTGPVILTNVNFAKECIFSKTIFESLKMENVDFETELRAIEMRCNGAFWYRGRTKSGANFDGALFGNNARFEGKRLTTIRVGGESSGVSSKSDYFLEGESRFQNVTFLNPELVTIQLADFRKTRVLGTNFDGVSFENVLWPRGFDKRLKVWDDVDPLMPNDPDYQAFAKNRVATVYRSLRRAHERQKDFSAANDFFVGEMEAKRKGDISATQSFVLNFYRFSCYYGTGPFRALLVFALLAILYGIITGNMTKSEFPSMFFGSLKDVAGFIVDVIGWGWDQLFIGLKQFIPGGGASTHTKIDVTFRILGALQFAMLVITFRNMVKRG